MAKTIGVLPDRVRIIGCQPAEVDDLFETLSPPVQAALATAVTRIEETVHAWL
jgi:Ni,Fe-hydrogenase maturation factor